MMTFAAAVGPVVAITLGSNIMATPPPPPPPPPPPQLPPPPPPPPSTVESVAVNASSSSPPEALAAAEAGKHDPDADAPDADLRIVGSSGSGTAAAGVRLQVLAGICLVRLVLSPLFGIALVWAGCRVGAIVADPVLLFVLLIESAMPSAMNLQLLTDIIAAGRGDASRSMARVLAAQYLASVVTITVFISLFLTLIKAGFFMPPP
jgi:hypothetical protein